MEWSRIREKFLYDLKRRPAGGRKRPSSAAEPRTASMPASLGLQTARPYRTQGQFSFASSRPSPQYDEGKEVADVCRAAHDR
jgi:hypothetical protein